MIVSAMLATNPELYEGCVGKIERDALDPLDVYARKQGEVSAVLNKALGKSAAEIRRINRKT